MHRGGWGYPLSVRRSEYRIGYRIRALSREMVSAGRPLHLEPLDLEERCDGRCSKVVEPLRVRDERRPLAKHNGYGDVCLPVGDCRVDLPTTALGGQQHIRKRICTYQTVVV